MAIFCTTVFKLSPVLIPSSGTLGPVYVTQVPPDLTRHPEVSVVDIQGMQVLQLLDGMDMLII